MRNETEQHISNQSTTNPTDLTGNPTRVNDVIHPPDGLWWVVIFSLWFSHITLVYGNLYLNMWLLRCQKVLTFEALYSTLSCWSQAPHEVRRKWWIMFRVNSSLVHQIITCYFLIFSVCLYPKVWTVNGFIKKKTLIVQMLASKIRFGQPLGNALITIVSYMYTFLLSACA